MSYIHTLCFAIVAGTFIYTVATTQTTTHKLCMYRDRWLYRWIYRPEYAFHKLALLVMDEALFLYVVQVDDQHSLQRHVVVEILCEKG